MGPKARFFVCPFDFASQLIEWREIGPIRIVQVIKVIRRVIGHSGLCHVESRGLLRGLEAVLPRKNLVETREGSLAAWEGGEGLPALGSDGDHVFRPVASRGFRVEVEEPAAGLDGDPVAARVETVAVELERVHAARSRCGAVHALVVLPIV